MQKNIYTYFNERVLENPAQTAVLQEGIETSYGRLKQRADEIAYGLSQAVSEEDHTIGILLHRSVDMVASILAINKLGLSYVPMDPLMPVERIHYMVEDSHTTVVITESEYKHLFDGLIVLECADIRQEGRVEIQGHNGEVAYNIYTSGSTGEPKGVIITCRSVINFFQGIDHCIDIGSCFRMLCLTTISFDIFVLESLYILYRGLTMVMSSDGIDSNPKLIMDLIKMGKVDMVQMTPSRIRMLQEYDREFTCFQGVKLLMVGGEGFPQDLLLELQKKTTAKIYNMYGPTEATVWCFVADLTNSNTVHIGEPLPGVTYKIHQDEKNDLKKGELYIGGSCLAHGYINKPALTSQKFIRSEEDEIYYKSGDYCTVNSQGEIVCLGRVDNQLKIRGYRVEPEEIEAAICGFRADLQCICLPEPKSGQHLVCYYVSGKEVDYQEIVAYIEKRLPQYMVPHSFVRVRKLSYMISGKLDRSYLKKHIDEFIMQGKEDSLGSPQKEDAFMQRIQKVLCEVSGQDLKADRNTTLTEVGINSIEFISLIVALEQEFDIIFEDDKLNVSLFPDIGSLYDYIENAGSSHLS